MKKADCPKGIQTFTMMLLVWSVIECDFIPLFISNQILAFGISPIIWGIGAFCILIVMKKQNKENLLYMNTSWNNKDWLILFFYASSKKLKTSYISMLVLWLLV